MAVGQGQVRRGGAVAVGDMHRGSGLEKKSDDSQAACARYVMERCVASSIPDRHIDAAVDRKQDDCVTARKRCGMERSQATTAHHRRVSFFPGPVASAPHLIKSVAISRNTFRAARTEFGPSDPLQPYQLGPLEVDRPLQNGHSLLTDGAR